MNQKVELMGYNKHGQSALQSSHLLSHQHVWDTFSLRQSPALDIVDPFIFCQIIYEKNLIVLILISLIISEVDHLLNFSWPFAFLLRIAYCSSLIPPHPPACFSNFLSSLQALSGWLHLPNQQKESIRLEPSWVFYHETYKTTLISAHPLFLPTCVNGVYHAWCLSEYTESGIWTPIIIIMFWEFSQLWAPPP